jgi:protein-S-isoprenylcysteine O-methyltransferase Ste14
LIIFHKANTTTTPGEISKKLVVSGPYRLTRNPMYVCLTLAYLGEAGFLNQIWPLLVLPLTLAYINWIVIPLEEDLLKNEFKEEYENYCTRVNRWF